MGFSLKQWMLFAGIDWLLKSAYLFIFERAAVFAPFMAVFMTVVHLTALCVVSFILSVMKVARFKLILSPILANVIFAGIMAWFYVSIYQSGSVTQCFNNQCWWVNGEITPVGIRVFAAHIGAYTVLNLVTFLAAHAAQSLKRRRRPDAGDGAEPAMRGKVG